MKFHRLAAASSAGFFLVSPCLGQDHDASAKEVRDMIADYTRLQQEFAEQYQKATPEERRELSQKRPSATPVVEKAQAFIKTAPAHDAVPEAAGWLLLYLRNDDRSFVYDALTGHHLGHAALGKATLSAMYDRSEQSTVFLNTILEKGEAAQAKAAAAYVLGYRMRNVTGEDAEKRLAYLKMAVKDLGDLEVRGRKVKAMAEGQLFAAENLTIGKVAPEIEGEDLEGVKFKLSDYRGKVVVIDFWGHW